MSGDGRPFDEVARREGIVAALRDAGRGRDARAVGALLAPDVSALVELPDGDRVALRGRAQVATRLMSAIAAADDAEVRHVNSQPGIVLAAGGLVTGVVSVRITVVVVECWVLLNPTRLSRLVI